MASQTPTTNTATTSTRWGKARNRHYSAMRIAAPLGILLAAASAALWGFIGPGSENPWLAITIFFAVTVAPWIMLIWAIVVDRNTISGATRRPEESVENQWLTQAAEISFFVVFMVTGVSSAVTSPFLGNPVSLTLLAIALLAMITFGVSYLIVKRR